MPTYQEIRGYKYYSDICRREVKRGSFFRILPSATFVSVRYSVTAKARHFRSIFSHLIGEFNIFLNPGVI